jgi:hypothetical protein
VDYGRNEEPVASRASLYIGNLWRNSTGSVLSHLIETNLHVEIHSMWAVTTAARFDSYGC